MFEVGFSELFLIGLVSLLVIGPEQLPKVARVAGFWIGKSRSFMTTIKQDIQDELYAEELKQTFKAEAERLEAEYLLEETASAFSATLAPVTIESTDHHEIK